MMKYIPVEMIRDTMDHLPDFPCPAGYTIRTFVPGNERLWAHIQAEAGEFDTGDILAERSGHGRAVGGVS